jgi:hypothetical protein
MPALAATGREELLLLPEEVSSVWVVDEPGASEVSWALPVVVVVVASVVEERDEEEDDVVVLRTTTNWLALVSQFASTWGLEGSTSNRPTPSLQQEARPWSQQ